MFSSSPPKPYSRGSTSSTSAKVIPEKPKSLSISLFSRKASKTQVMTATLEKLQCEIDGLKLVVSALNRNIGEFKAELSNQKSYAESLASSIDQEGTGVRINTLATPIYNTLPPPIYRYEEQRRLLERRTGEENCCYCL
jgi:hypothetical protein